MSECSLGYGGDQWLATQDLDRRRDAGDRSAVGELLALRWADIALGADRPDLTIDGTIKTAPGKGHLSQGPPPEV